MKQTGHTPEIAAADRTAGRRHRLWWKAAAAASKASPAVVVPMVETLESRLVMAGGLIASAVVPWLQTRGLGNGNGGGSGGGGGGGSTGPHVAVNKSFVVFNDVRGGSASPGVGLTISNTGNQPLSVSSLSIGGGDVGQFQIASGGSGTTLQPGGSANVTLTYSAPSGTALGLHTSTLTIASSDPTTPSLAVPLRALATIGTGGQNEPSLQRIFDLYQLNLRTGDANPADTNLYSATSPLGANDEVLVQTLVKSGTGQVTITPLAAFAGGSPVVRFGYYGAGNASARTEVFTVPSPDAQTVNPGTSGSTSFDPGSSAFGLYVTFPITNNTAYSEDNLNTAESTAANRRKVRFYPLKNADGSVVPNAFVFTSEDFINDPTGAYDTNDFIGIIRNVRAASAGTAAALAMRNLDGAPSDDRMVFNRIERQPPALQIDPDTLVEYQPPDNVTHDQGTFRLTNTGGSPLTITGTSLDSTAWTFVNQPAAGTVLQPGQTLDVTLKFVAHGLPPGHSGNETADPTGLRANRGASWIGHLTVNTDSPTSPVNTCTLAGWWQLENENNEEPSLDTLVNKLFGYQTSILTAGQKLDTAGAPTPIGEEVLSAYWTQADAGKPVSVRQIAAWHTQGHTAQMSYYIRNGSAKAIVNHDGVMGQSLLPTLNGRPSSATFNTTGTFGFRVDTEWSDDKFNKPGTPTDKGHHIRFFPLRDAAGNTVPDTYLMCIDYQARNFDFQDNVYIISNIKPAGN